MQNITVFLVVMVALTAFAVLLQVISLFAMAIIAKKAVREAKSYADEFRVLASPVLQSSRDLLQLSKQLIERLEPRLDAAATDLAEMAHIANEETRKIQASAKDITDRIRRQAERMDGIATNALNNVDRVGHFLNEAVNLPLRQVSGVLAAAKAIMETLRGPAPAQRRARPDGATETKTGQFA